MRLMSCPHCHGRVKLTMEADPAPEDDGMPRSVLAVVEDDEVARTRALFHRLWGKARDAEGYDKDEWLKLEKALDARLEAGDAP